MLSAFEILNMFTRKTILTILEIVTRNNNTWFSLHNDKMQQSYIPKKPLILTNTKKKTHPTVLTTSI